MATQSGGRNFSAKRTSTSSSYKKSGNNSSNKKSYSPPSSRGKTTGRPATKKPFGRSNADSDDNRTAAPKRTYSANRSSGAKFGKPTTRKTGSRDNETSTDGFKKSAGKKPYGSTRTSGKPAYGKSNAKRSFTPKEDFENTSGRKPAKRSYADAKSSPNSRFSKTEKRFNEAPEDRKDYAKRSFTKTGDNKRSGSTSRFTKNPTANKTSRTRTQTEDKPRFSSEKNSRGYSKTSAPKYADSKPRTKVTNEENLNGTIRLNKYISNAGICSRRDADDLIQAGLVSVNGEVITEMGYQVKPTDEVKYNNARLSTEKKVYIVMNKSKDTITTNDDPEGRKTVTQAFAGTGLPRLYPVGRLDRNTTGVLLITNDGELAQRLMHPKYQVQKIYKATLDKNFRGEDLWTITNGIELEDGPIKPDSIAVDQNEKNEVVVEIHSGRNRIIHRMFEHLGYKVDRLDRIWYAGFDKRGLKRGEWRELSDKELTALKKLVKLK